MAKYRGIIIKDRVYTIVERKLASQSESYRKFYDSVRAHFETYPERTASSELILDAGLVLPFKEYIVTSIMRDFVAFNSMGIPEKDYLNQRVAGIIDRIERDANRYGRGAPPEDRTARCPECGTVVPTVTMQRSLVRNDTGNTRVVYAKICSDCYEDQLEVERSIVSKQTWDTVRKYDEAMQECKFGKTCGVITAHKKGLGDDPERLTSTFMIGMTCGINGLRKYLIKRGDITKAQSDSMSDESLEEYINTNNL